MLIVAALYRFTRFADPEGVRGPLRDVCEAEGVKGSLLIASEGINGTIAGTRAGIDAVLAHVRGLPGCVDLEWKESTAAEMPFGRMKVRLKREIVTMGVPGTGPQRAGRDLCGPKRLERPDRGAGRGGDRHAERLRDGHRHVSGCGRSGDREFPRFPRVVGAEPRQVPQQADRDVLHRRHPLREIHGLPEGAGGRGSLSPPWRHPEIPRGGAGRSRAFGRAAASCSTSGSLSATACARLPASTLCRACRRPLTSRRTGRGRSSSRASPATAACRTYSPRPTARGSAKGSGRSKLAEARGMRRIWVAEGLKRRARAGPICVMMTASSPILTTLDSAQRPARGAANPSGHPSSRKLAGASRFPRPRQLLAGTAHDVPPDHGAFDAARRRPILDGNRDAQGFAPARSRAMGGCSSTSCMGITRSRITITSRCCGTKDVRRSSAGFDLLDADHHALDGILNRFVEQANGAIHGRRAGPHPKCGVQALLARRVGGSRSG
jgi:hypothetical protein